MLYKLAPRSHVRSIALILLIMLTSGMSQSYRIVDTGQTLFYDDQNEISAPASGAAFYGQDAQIMGHQPSYTDNNDGTITDNVTGLMWQQSADLNGDGSINYADKLSQSEALAGADTFSLAGYSDWRLPSIKEAYSLFMASGEDPSGYSGTDTDGLSPFIDTEYFHIDYGDTDAGERIIDAQFASSTIYVATTMNGDATMFGVNFVDGRIKGYPMGPMPGQSEDKQFYVLYVRDNNSYGSNDFIDNADSTVTDLATGLMWMQNDSEHGMDWEASLAWAQSRNNQNYLGYSDWRVPNVKELHSILDYGRAPAITNSAALDPIFDCSIILDEGGGVNYPSFWSSTTHANMQNGHWGAYVCFGEALGWMAAPVPPFDVTLLDVHGAGAQRSDPKSGSADDYPQGHGPHGDVVRIDNYVRLVRDMETTSSVNDTGEHILPTSILLQNYPNPFNPSTRIAYRLSQDALIQLYLYNLRGQMLAVLDQGQRSSGSHTVQFHGSEFDSGIYFVSLEVNGLRSTRKIHLLK